MKSPIISLLIMSDAEAFPHLADFTVVSISEVVNCKGSVKAYRGYTAFVYIISSLNVAFFLFRIHSFMFVVI